MVFPPSASSSNRSPSRSSDDGDSLYASYEEATDNARGSLPELVNDTKDSLFNSADDADDDPFNSADDASDSPPKSTVDKGKGPPRLPAMIRSRNSYSSFMDNTLRSLSLDGTRDASERSPAQTRPRHSTISTERRSIYGFNSGRSRDTTPRSSLSDPFRGGSASPESSSTRGRDLQQWKSTLAVSLWVIWDLTAETNTRKERRVGRKSPQEVQDAMPGE